MKTIRALLVAITLVVSLITPTIKVSAGTPLYQSQTGYLVTKDMPVIVFPLTRDGFYKYLNNRSTNTSSTVRTYVLSGVGVGYSGLYLMQDPTNPEGMLRYTVFHHTLKLSVFHRTVRLTHLHFVISLFQIRQQSA